MTWKDRIREAAYTAPDGTRQVFEFVDVRKMIRKRTTPHEFIDVAGTFVQDQGLKGRQFPLRVYFSGENHDLAANAFESLLMQPGPGTLEHPLYGAHTVVPFGDISRSDALVTAGNQTIFDITFWETVTDLYPSADDATVDLVDAAVNDYDGEQFAASVETANPGDNATFGANMRALKNGASSGLRAAQDGTAALRNRMNRIDKAIDSTIDLLGAPLTLAAQVKQLVTAPARSLQLARARLDAYQNLAASIVAGKGTGGSGGGTGSSDSGTGVVDPGTGAPGARADASNTFHANKLFAETIVLSVALTVSGESYRTRQQALDAAFELAELHDTIADWSEENYSVLFTASAGPDTNRPNSSGVGAIDTGESRAVVLDTVTKTLKYLIATSFTLGVERTRILDEPRTVIDLVAELYGSLEPLDEFIAANSFTGDQLLELQPGTTVRYYAE